MSILSWRIFNRDLDENINKSVYITLLISNFRFSMTFGEVVLLLACVRATLALSDIWRSCAGSVWHLKKLCWFFLTFGEVVLVLSDIWRSYAGSFWHLEKLCWFFLTFGEVVLALSDIWRSCAGSFWHLEKLCWLFLTFGEVMLVLSKIMTFGDLVVALSAFSEIVLIWYSCATFYIWCSCAIGTSVWHLAKLC